MPYTPAQKRATYKYVEKNRERFNEYMKTENKKYYEKNKEEKNRKDLARYYYKKEARKFLLILFVD